MEFGWNESEVTNPTAILYFCIAFITIGMGALLDRFSARAIMIIGSLGLLGAMVAYASIQSLTPALRRLSAVLAVLGCLRSGPQHVHFDQMVLQQARYRRWHPTYGIELWGEPFFRHSPALPSAVWVGAVPP